MSRIHLLTLTSLASLSAACLGDQSYTPIGEESADELCQQSLVSLNEIEQVALEVDASGQASYSGLLEVTDFSRTEMRVDTDEIIISVPAQSKIRVSVAEGNWDFFTDMVFAVDMREPGDSEWRELSVSASAYDLFWFKEVEFNAPARVSALSSLALCTSQEISAENLALELEGDYELRIRPFPFEGLGDLVGQYDYTIDVSIVE